MDEILDEIITTKTCHVCGIVRNIDRFSIAIGKKGQEYRRNKCKDCINDERKMRELSNNEISLRQFKTYFSEVDLEILKVIIKEFKLKNAPDKIKTAKEIIEENISEDSEKVNKTYSIYPEIELIIQEYCKKKKFFLSEFIMVAAIEYINNHK